MFYEKYRFNANTCPFNKVQPCGHSDAGYAALRGGGSLGLGGGEETSLGLSADGPVRQT